MSFFYTAYGLSIRSSFPLPELIFNEQKEHEDVFIQLRKKLDFLPPNLISHNAFRWQSADDAYLFWEKVGAIRVRDRREIIVAPIQEQEKPLLNLSVLEWTMASLLEQRGLLVLHASAVVVNDSVVVFLGHSGQGKSTTASAFYTCGHSIVTDDMTAIKVEDVDSPDVLPGFPQLKLLPDIAAYWGNDLGIMSRVTPWSEKFAQPVPRGFRQSSLPLKCIYILAEDTEQGIDVLSPKKAFIQLLSHSYFRPFLGSNTAAASYLNNHTRLANCVPIRRLRKQKCLAELPNLVRLVEKDLANNLINQS